jgi:hypothetical protein
LSAYRRGTQKGEYLLYSKFDMKKRIFTMHFSNKHDPDLPASFSLSANKTKAVLSIIRKKLRANSIGTFNATCQIRAHQP